jgi:hypothetical protein
MRQRLYLNDNEIGKSVLPLWMLMEQKPWGKQYTTSLGLCHGRATLTFRLQLFAFPDNSSPPLSTPLHALEKLEKRFGKEITLLDNIQPPANVLGFLQVNNPPRELILSSHSLDICLAATHIPPPPPPSIFIQFVFNQPYLLFLSYYLELYRICLQFEMLGSRSAPGRFITQVPTNYVELLI